MMCGQFERRRVGHHSQNVTMVFHPVAPDDVLAVAASTFRNRG
jgi:hypothetical protein